MNQVKNATEAVVVTSHMHLLQKAEAIEDKLRKFPHMYQHLMPELQRVRAEILIKG